MDPFLTRRKQGEGKGKHTQNKSKTRKRQLDSMVVLTCTAPEKVTVVASFSSKRTVAAKIQEKHTEKEESGWRQEGTNSISNTGSH